MGIGGAFSIVWGFGLIVACGATPAGTAEGPWTANVLECGAKADGETDDTAAFQAALDAAADKGGLGWAAAVS